MNFAFLIYLVNTILPALHGLSLFILISCLTVVFVGTFHVTLEAGCNDGLHAEIVKVRQTLKPFKWFLIPLTTA